MFRDYDLGKATRGQAVNKLAMRGGGNRILEPTPLHDDGRLNLWEDFRASSPNPRG